MTKEEKREYDIRRYQASKEKIAARIAEYYQANKDKVAARMVEYYQTNKEKKLEYQAEYRKANKEKIAAHKSEYYQANKEKFAEYYQANKEEVAVQKAEYRATPIGRAVNLLSGYRQSDKKHNRSECTLTPQWIVDNIFNKPCHYCGESDWHKIGCDRIDNSKPHTEDNVVPCCSECNIKRKTMEYNEFK